MNFIIFGFFFYSTKNEKENNVHDQLITYNNYYWYL